MGIEDLPTIKLEEAAARFLAEGLIKSTSEELDLLEINVNLKVSIKSKAFVILITAITLYLLSNQFS